MPAGFVFYHILLPQQLIILILYEQPQLVILIFFFCYYDWILCVWAEFTVKFKTSKYGSFCGFFKMVQIHTYFWVKIMSGSCSVERIVHCFLRFFSKFKPSQLLSPPGQDRRAKHWQFDLPSQVSPALAAAGPVCSLLEDRSQPAPGQV